MLASPPNVPVTILPLPPLQCRLIFDYLRLQRLGTFLFAQQKFLEEELSEVPSLLLLSPLMLSPFSFLQRGRENGENFKGEKRVADGPDESMLASPSLPPVLARCCISSSLLASDRDDQASSIFG